MDQRKILMTTILQPHEERALLPLWLKSMDAERTESRQDIEGLILLRNYNEKRLGKVQDIAEQGYLHVMNVGISPDKTAWATAMQFGVMNEFEFVTTVKINCSPSDGFIIRLLKYAQRDGMGCVTGIVPIRRGDRYFLNSMVMRGNIIGQRQAEDNEHGIVWLDATGIGTAMFTAPAIKRTPIEWLAEKSSWKNWEYGYTNNMKRSGFNVVLNREVQSLLMNIEPDTGKVRVHSLTIDNKLTREKGLIKDVQNIDNRERIYRKETIDHTR